MGRIPVASILWGLVLGAGPAGAQDPAAGAPTTIEQQLEAALEAGFSQSNGIGYSVSVLLPGQPMWTGVRGVSHQTVPITPASGA
jgi:hypothetical protein